MASIVMTLIGDIRYDGRVRKEIQTLTAAGHHIELVVSDFGKNGKAADDLGITIHPIPSTLWRNPAMNFAEQLHFNQTAASIIRKLAPTHIHCHNLNTLLAGVWAKRKIGARLVFDAHELMPESLGGIKQRVWGQIEKRCVDTCDYIIMPEKHRIKYFKQKYPSVREIYLLENFPRKTDIPQEAVNLLRERYPITADQKIILHTGILAARRHVDELIESMVISTNQFVLVLLGTAYKGYETTLRKKIKSLGLVDRIYLHPSVPYTQLLHYMASCDIGVAFYQNTNLNNYYCASNKLFELIALNKVVLTNDYPGLLETVGDYKQGVCLREITPKNLAEAYIRASDSNHIRPGRRKYFWEDEEKILSGLYDIPTRT